MTLDPYTDFWVSQGGHQDQVSADWAQARDNAASESSEPEQTFEDDEHYAAARAAADEVRGREDDRSDWSAAEPHFKYFEEQFGWKPTEVCNFVDNVDQDFRRDRVRARENYERLARRLQAEFRPRVSATSSKNSDADKPPDGLNESGRSEWERDQDVRNAFLSAAKRNADNEHFETAAKFRQRLKEIHGKPAIASSTARYREIAELSLTDPVAAANRISLLYGAPATAGEAQEHQAVAQQQHEYGEARKAAAEDLTNQMGIDALPPEVQTRMADFIEDARRRGIAQNVEEWPLLVRHAYDAARNELAAERAVREESANSIIEQFTTDPANKYYAKLENEIANILMSGRVQRTGDMRADLKAAYDMAVRRNPEIAAEKARRAARSVTGGPAPGARSAATQRSRGGSYDDDLFGDVADAVRARSI